MISIADYVSRLGCVCVYVVLVSHSMFCVYNRMQLTCVTFDSVSKLVKCSFYVDVETHSRKKVTWLW